MKTPRIFLGFVISLLSVSLISGAQEKDEAEIQKMIDSKNLFLKHNQSIHQAAETAS